MNYIFVADGWGAHYGGINAFNYDLCNNFSKAISSKDRVICITINASSHDVDLASNNGVKLINFHKDDFKRPESVVKEIKCFAHKDNCVLIGHDVKTSNLAKSCAQLLQCKWAFIHHMSYNSYYTLISKNAEKTEVKSEEQMELIKSADYIFAVGPKLKDSAEDIVTLLGLEGKKSVHEICPGLAPITPTTKALKHFRAVTLGRMNNDVNIIKQGKLALAGFAKALTNSDNIMKKDDSIMMIGLENDINQYNELANFSEEFSLGKSVNILPLPYTNNRNELFNKIRATSVCLMLSIHEGFGLTGLEAISAGVPLILSKNSGLYNMLINTGIDNIEQYFEAVIIEGTQTGKHSFTNNDLENISNLILKIRKQQNIYKKSALELKEKLIEKGVNWKETAKVMTSVLDIEEENSPKKKSYPKYQVDNAIPDHLLDKINFVDKENNDEYINRKKLKNDFQMALESRKIVSIEGMSGSGKKSFLHNYFSDEAVEYSALVYECEESETLDLLLGNLYNVIGVEGSISNYSEIIKWFSDSNTVLVLSNFSRVDSNSFEDFLIKVRNSKTDMRLVLSCRESVELEWKNDIIYSIEMTGLERDCFDEYIEILKLGKLTAKDKDKLFRKTHGHPYAIKLFANIVIHLRRKPSLLLKGKIIEIDRTISTWIEEIYESLKDDEKLLLSVLSICEIPFNETLLNIFINNFKSEKVKPYTFSNLQKKYMVNKITNYNWVVQNLISEYANKKLEKSVLIKVYKCLAEYYEINSRNKYSRNDIGIRTKWGIQSIIHFQNAELYDESARMLKFHSRYIKKLGLYETYLRLAKNEVQKNRNRNRWVDYHYAHTCHILGYKSEAIKMLDIIIANNNTDLNMRLSSFRLKAEVLVEMSNPEKALECIVEGENIINNECISEINVSHFNQIKAMVLIENGMFTEAKTILELLMTDDITEAGNYANAIAYSRLAQCDEFEIDYDDRVSLLEKASKLFLELKDSRGYSWSCLHLARLKLSKKDLMNDMEFISMISKAVLMKKEAEENTMDYKRVLLRLSRLVTTGNLNDLIKEELSRLSYCS